MHLTLFSFLDYPLNSQFAPLSMPLTIPPKCPASPINNTVASEEII